MTTPLPAAPGQTPRPRTIARLVVVNWALGMAAGTLCATMILALDLAGLRGLLLRADEPWIGLALLYGGFGFSFGGLVAATAVMTISEKSPTR